MALQRVCVVAGKAAWGSWVGAHCHILLTCTDRHQQFGDAADALISESNVMLHAFAEPVSSLERNTMLSMHSMQE